MLLTTPFEDETFLEIEVRSLPTRAGSCPVPLLYRDSSMLALMFATDLRRAARLVGGRTIEPWPLVGRALTVVCAFDHRDAAIGSHAEIAIFVVCRQVGSAPSLLRFALDMRAMEDQGAWVVGSGVTTDDAVEAGELWGYPRRRAAIQARSGPKRTHVETTDLSIEVEHPLGPPVRTLPLMTYSARDGRLIRTIIETEGLGRVGLGQGSRITLKGEGPLASPLAELGLDRARPLLVTRVERLRARVPPGADLGPL